MTRPLHAGISRILNRKTIVVDNGCVIVSAKNSNFPRLTEIAAARLMVSQDIDRTASNYSPTISKDAMK